MATYRAIQQEVKATYGFTPKTGWIAHVLSERGINTGNVPRRNDASVRVEPCPADKRCSIEAVIEKLG
jgi:hypothetical protein